MLTRTPRNRRLTLLSAGIGALALGALAAPAGAVTYQVPGGFPTIQDAIDVCVDGDVVMVADGVYSGPGNFDLDFGGRLITVMSLNGPDFCAIDCMEMGRAFTFQTGETADAIVSGFTIRNGLILEDGGGAILMSGTSPTVRNCFFENNTAYSAAASFPTGSGGAIFSSGGSPAIEGCDFTGNTAGFAASAPGTGFGGAIFMFLGGGSVTDCNFTGNLADGPGGFGNGIGGGMFVLFANPDLDTCTFTDNSAVIAGGGVWLQGTATTDVRDCTFDGNTAQSGGGLAVFEGAATVHGSSFVDNSVASADPLVQQQIGGGAIGCADTVTVTISDCFFTGNTSADGVGGAVSSIGGSTATIENCEFMNNSATTTGGAVHNGAAPGSGDVDLELPSTMTMTGCTLVANDAAGGGGGASNQHGSTMTVANCDFEGNTAFTGTGGFPTGSGGAISSVGSTSFIEGCDFTSNTAGFASSAPGTGFGGAIFMFLGGGSVTDSTFTGNLADGPGGFGNGIGGGMFVLFAGSDLDGCAFNDNHAVIAGGGVWLQGTANADIGNCTFEGNTAQSGGGLAVFEGAATVHDSSFTNNSVASDDAVVQQRIGGGAIGCADTVTVMIDRCFFTGNTSADGVGGAVSTVGGSSAMIVNSAFGENGAFMTGGAVHNGAIPGSGDPDLELTSTTTMINCLVACNTASEMGGGAFNGDGGTMAMVNCTVAHNTAGGGGGGLANMMMGSTTTADNCIFYQNRSDFSPHVSEILDGPGGVTVNHSIVQRGWDGVGVNNLRKNPKFVDATPGGGFAVNDYHLRFNSPAIDAGDDGVVTVMFDLDGNTRIVGPAIDMGAYEFQD